MAFLKSWKQRGKLLSKRSFVCSQSTFKNEGQIKTSEDKKKKKERKLKEFLTSRPALEEMLNGVLQAEIKGY